jgi:hypothetical protein
MGGGHGSRSRIRMARTRGCRLRLESALCHSDLGKSLRMWPSLPYLIGGGAYTWPGLVTSTCRWIMETGREDHDIGGGSVD